MQGRGGGGRGKGREEKKEEEVRGRTGLLPGSLNIINGARESIIHNGGAE